MNLLSQKPLAFVGQFCISYRSISSNDRAGKVMYISSTLPDTSDLKRTEFRVHILFTMAFVGWMCLILTLSNVLHNHRFDGREHNDCLACSFYTTVSSSIAADTQPLNIPLTLCCILHDTQEQPYTILSLDLHPSRAPPSDGMSTLHYFIHRTEGDHHETRHSIIGPLTARNRS